MNSNSGITALLFYGLRTCGVCANTLTTTITQNYSLKLVPEQQCMKIH
jgi:hypothetical protein